jgi:hypothetical protein
MAEPSEAKAETMGSMPEHRGRAGRWAKGADPAPPRISPPFRHRSSGRAPLRVACPWMTKRKAGPSGVADAGIKSPPPFNEINAFREFFRDPARSYPPPESPP